MITDVIGSIAAFSTLLIHTINIVQKVREAREKVQGASNLLDCYNSQLEGLVDTLRLVQDERALQTPPIERQVRAVATVGQELEANLDLLTTRLQKGQRRQFVHTFVHGDKEEKDLNSILDRLDRAKTNLNAHIVITHVGVSRTLQSGFVGAMSTVERVDRNVQRVLGQRLAVAMQLDGRQSEQDENGNIPLTDEDIRAFQTIDKSQYIDNVFCDEAYAFNGNVGDSNTQHSLERIYKGNKVGGKSFVVNGSTSGDALAAILQSRQA